MPKHPLVNYIKDAEQKGWTAEHIGQVLTTAGWRVHDLVEIVLDQPPRAESVSESAPVQKVAPIISIQDVSKTFGKVKALDNVSLEVKKGSVTALLGPNGAGKTTLVRVMTTLLSHDSGRVTVAGLDVKEDAQALRSVIGLAGQYAAVDEILSGRENLEMVGRLYHLSKRAAVERASELLKRFRLEDAADRPVKTYSGGMRRRLDLAASLVINPKILFLDEPTTGLDPRSRFDMWHIIRDLVRDGTTVLLTTQYLEEADQLANQIFVIDHGRIIAQGTVDELKSQVGGDVIELHLVEPQDALHAAEVIKPFGDAAPRPDADTGMVVMPVSGGASVVVDVIRKLDAEGLKLRDVSLRRPSLDDVFMKLTGHATE